MSESGEGFPKIDPLTRRPLNQSDRYTNSPELQLSFVVPADSTKTESVAKKFSFPM